MAASFVALLLALRDAMILEVGSVLAILSDVYVKSMFTYCRSSAESYGST
jgi:hypothetical protein